MLSRSPPRPLSRAPPRPPGVANPKVMAAYRRGKRRLDVCQPHPLCHSRPTDSIIAVHSASDYRGHVERPLAAVRPVTS